MIDYLSSSRLAWKWKDRWNFSVILSVAAGASDDLVAVLFALVAASRAAVAAVAADEHSDQSSELRIESR